MPCPLPSRRASSCSGSPVASLANVKGIAHMRIGRGRGTVNEMRNWFEVNKAWIVRTVGTRFGIFILIAAGVLASASVGHASATNVYVSQNGGSFSGGSACNGQTTISLAAFQGSSLWGGGATQIGPGTTVYICGAITVSQNTNFFTFWASGTSGNPITIIWDTGAVVSSPYWPTQGSGGAIYATNVAYVVINGGTNGVLQATANGSALANQQQTSTSS